MPQFVTLVLDSYDGSGALTGQGAAVLTPSVQLTDPSDLMWIPPSPVWGAFNAAASPRVSLLATDNTGPEPAGWNWTIQFRGVPGNPASFSFFLPFSSGAVQYLSSLAPVAGATPVILSDLDGGSAAGGGFPAGTINGGSASG